MRPPAFQFYADDFIAGTITMTREERGLYIILLCMQWNVGHVTADDFERLGNGMADASLNHVKRKFETDPEGLFRNKRLEQVRQEQEEHRKARQNAGKAGAEARWHPHSNAINMPLAKNGSPSPSPSPSPKKGITSQTSHSKPKAHGTRLTFSALSRLAQDIKENRNGWHYDNHKLDPSTLVTAGLVGKLRPFVDRLTEQQVRETWAEAALKTHQAAVDGMNITHSLAHYAVGIWREEMEKLATPISD